MTGTTSTERWVASDYQRNAGFVAELGADLLDLLAPRPRERILDLGCGDGVLTERIAGHGAEVVGLDSAAGMLTAARARGLTVVEGDGHALPFSEEFDAVFSNAALHWMTRPNAVLDGVARALKPGGRFVGEFGGHGNVAAIKVALLAVMARRGVDAEALIPWYFPTAEEYGERLEAHGFTVERIGLHPRPTPLPGAMEGWLDTFASWCLGPLDPEARKAAVQETEALLAPALKTAEGRWTADYVRLRFSARLTDQNA